MKPINIRELVSLKGVEGAAKAIYCGKTLIRDALKNDNVTPVYELAAAKVLDNMDEVITLETPDDYRRAIRDYFKDKDKNLATLSVADFNFYLSSIAKIVHEPE